MGWEWPKQIYHILLIKNLLLKSQKDSLKILLIIAKVLMVTLKT